MRMINEETIQAIEDGNGYFTCKRFWQSGGKTYMNFHQETGEDLAFDCQIVGTYQNGQKVDDFEFELLIPEDDGGDKAFTVGDLMRMMQIELQDDDED